MIKVAGIALLAALVCQEKANPQYEYWSGCKVGSWVKNRMDMENQGQKFELESTTKLLEVTPEKILIETSMKTGHAPAYLTAFAGAIKVSAGSRTSSSG